MAGFEVWGQWEYQARKKIETLWGKIKRERVEHKNKVGWNHNEESPIESHSYIVPRCPFRDLETYLKECERTGYNIRYNINLTNWNGIKSNQIIIDIRIFFMVLEIIFLSCTYFNHFYRNKTTRSVYFVTVNIINY